MQHRWSLHNAQTVFISRAIDNTVFACGSFDAEFERFYGLHGAKYNLVIETIARSLYGTATQK
jgi:hypothetical protein